MSTTSIRRVRTTDLDLKDRLVSIQRVTKVTKGGRTFSFSAVVVVGNEDGIVGFGLGKANEVTTAIAKGVEDAKKNLIKIYLLGGGACQAPALKPLLPFGDKGFARNFLRKSSTKTAAAPQAALRAAT